MRRFFIGMLLLTLSLGSVLGSAFAWGTQQSAVGVLAVGKQSFEVLYTPKCLEFAPLLGLAAGSETLSAAPSDATGHDLPTVASDILAQPAIQSVVGSLPVQNSVPPQCTKFATAGPNDGLFRQVGEGVINNTGNFDLTVTDGSLTITGLKPTPLPLPGAPCLPTDFSARVRFKDRLATADHSVAAHFLVEMAVRSGAPDSCTNRLLSYELVFNATGVMP